MSNRTKRVVVIGANGTIGGAIVNALEERGHDVLQASRSGALRVDLEDTDSIGRLLDEVGPVDAIISAAGRASFGAAAQADDASFELSLQSKLMGQVNLIRLSARRPTPPAAVIVTTGILGTSPGPGTAPVAMVNAGLEGFVRAAALDLPRGPRVLAVSPPFVRETAMRMGMGEVGMPASMVAARYVEAVEGEATGMTLHP